MHYLTIEARDATNSDKTLKKFYINLDSIIAIHLSPTPYSDGMYAIDHANGRFFVTKEEAERILSHIAKFNLS